MATSPPSEEPRAMPTYPPYPPYEPQPVPPSVADVILLGQDIRFDHKSGQPLKLKPSPRPARPKAIKATTEVKMTNRERLAHARCLRRYGAVLTDRLERISKPDRRKIIMMWRERQDTLPVDTIARLRAMLDADEPFKPEQAYDYFLNLRKSKKKSTPGGRRRKEMRKDVMALCEDRRYEWARNAAVAFARGIQQRLARPGMYSLQDEMLRLSNIILQDICGFLKTRAPSRHCVHPKARLMVEIADKVAVWINEILTESEDRMLMMDFDENEEVEQHAADKKKDDSGQMDKPSRESNVSSISGSREHSPSKGENVARVQKSPSMAENTSSRPPSPTRVPSAQGSKEGMQQTSKKSSNAEIRKSIDNTIKGVASREKVKSMDKGGSKPESPRPSDAADKKP